MPIRVFCEVCNAEILHLDEAPEEYRERLEKEEIKASEIPGLGFSVDVVVSGKIFSNLYLCAPDTDGLLETLENFIQGGDGEGS